MSQPDNPFRYFNSSPQIIRLVVMMYVRFPLSLRNVEDLLFERGIDICHETVRLWWNRFGPMFAAGIRRQRVSKMKGFRHWRWHVDEVFVKLNGETHYLWRAVDHEGEILESYVTKKRDKCAALRFLKKALNRFDLLGDIVSQGVELSVTGELTPRLNVVAGGVLLRPRVTGEGVALGRVGSRPVGLAGRSIDLNADWRPPVLSGLSVDVGVSHTGSVVATRNNLVRIPARTLVDVGARYRFKLSGKNATIRARVSNVGNVYGYELRGAGAYDIIAGRVASAYLTVDF